jgi:hypothetical protein
MELNEDTIKELPFFMKSIYRNGVMRATVLSNQDPERRGRLQVRISHLHPILLSAGPATSGPASLDTQPISLDPISGELAAKVPQQGVPDNLCPWAEPAFPFGGNTGTDAGFIMIPEKDSTVWVGFEMGFIGRPVWFGAWLGLEDMPSEVTDPDKIRIIKTPLGHKLIFDDTTGIANVDLESSTGHKLLLDETSATPRILLESAGGHQVLLDDTGGQNKIDIRTTVGHEVKINDATSTLTAQLTGPPNTKLELTPTAATLSIGTSSIVITPTGVTITINGYTISLNSVGDTVITANGVMTINANGILTLGTGAVKGVALDSLLTVLNAFITVYNTHTHTDPQGGITGTPSVPGVPGVPGVDTSVTVLARA